MLTGDAVQKHVQRCLKLFLAVPTCHLFMLPAAVLMLLQLEHIRELFKTAWNTALGADFLRGFLEAHKGAQVRRILLVPQFKMKLQELAI